MKVVGVPKEQFENIWPHVKDFFGSFADRAKGELTVGDLVLGIKQGTRQMWVATDGREVKALALTEVERPPMRTVVINFCAGRDREEWRDEMVETIAAWGKAIGSGRLRIVCRPGWARELKSMKETHRVLERDL